MMRVLLALFALAGPVEASSIVEVKPMSETLGPSMVAFQDKTTPHVATLPAADATPSVVAFGEPVADQETVAAIPQEPRLYELVPMVIRGGIVGSAFSTPAPAAGQAPAQQPEETAAAPEAERRPAERPQAAPAPSGPPPQLGGPE